MILFETIFDQWEVKMKKILIRLSVVVFALLFWAGSHADDAEATTLYTQNIIPKLTTETIDAGYAKSSSYYGRADPIRAFDSYKTDEVGGRGRQALFWGTDQSTGWLSYELSTPKVVAKYAIYADVFKSDSLLALPNTWTFEGSNDGGTTWTVLDAQSGITWGNSVVQGFPINNTVGYKTYRINVTANNGSTGKEWNLMIPELEMMEVSTSTTAAPFLTGTSESTVNHLTWEPVSDAISYNVKRGGTGGPYETIASGLTGTSFDDSNVTLLSYNYYVVTAVRATGESDNSNELSLMPKFSFQNMLLNPSFEQYTGTNGVADYWKPYIAVGSTAEYSIVTTPVSDGGHSERMYASGLGLNQAVEVFQRIKVQPNKPFRLTSDFNIPNLSNAKVQLWVDYYRSETGWDWSNKKYYDYVETTEGGFVTLELFDTIPSDVVSVQVYAILKGTGANGTGTVYVDNMKFVQ
jgi:hypothetical protein